MERVHQYLGLISIVIGVLFVLISSAIPNEWNISKKFFANIGTAFIAVGVVESLYKTFLQRDLIILLKNAISMPIEAIYLRRQHVPQEKTIFNILFEVKDTIYIKGISFSITKPSGLLEQVSSITPLGSTDLARGLS